MQYAEQTTSTMDDARAGADRRGDASVGTAYVGGQQTAGRGRQGRQWISEPGAGLYVTYHLAPRLELPRVPLLAAAGALAVADACHRVAGVATSLKWPNDVLHDGRKLAGILAEARYGQRLDVFLGIGLNLREAALPPEVRDLATSLEALSGERARLEDVLAALSFALEAWSDRLERDPEAVVDAWQKRLVTLGERVYLTLPTGAGIEGMAQAVTPLGDLVVLHDDGSTGRYSAGDVTTGNARNNHDQQ